MDNKPLIQYVRDRVTRHPVGVVVAVSPNSFGFSLCNPKDRFNKARGKSIATQRAMSQCITLDIVSLPVVRHGPLIPRYRFRDVSDVILSLARRAKKYYKE